MDHFEVLNDTFLVKIVSLFFLADQNRKSRRPKYTALNTHQSQVEFVVLDAADVLGDNVQQVRVPQDGIALVKLLSRQPETK